RLTEAQDDEPSGRPWQFRHSGGSEGEMAERRLLAIAPLADGDGLDAVPDRPDRRDDRRILGGRGSAAQENRQQIGELSEPPAEKFAQHDRRPSPLQTVPPTASSYKRGADATKADRATTGTILREAREYGSIMAIAGETIGKHRRFAARSGQ